MADLVTLDIRLDPKSLAKAVKHLDQWQGAPLAQRTQKAQQAGMKLYVPALKARAARHNRTGKTQRGYAVRKLPKKTYAEIGAFKVSSNTWYKHFAIVGTKRGVQQDPYVADVRDALTGSVVSFIERQITRLA